MPPLCEANFSTYTNLMSYYNFIRNNRIRNLIKNQQLACKPKMSYKSENLTAARFKSPAAKR